MIKEDIDDKYSKNTKRDLKSGIITVNIWSGTDKQKWNNLKWTMNRNLKLNKCIS